MKKKLEKIFADYGPIALVIWFVIFGLTIVGFAMAIQAGVKVESAAGTAGVWGAAYIATQLTKPIRIFATLGLTALVGRFWNRRRSSESR